MCAAVGWCGAGRCRTAQPVWWSGWRGRLPESCAARGPEPQRSVATILPCLTKPDMCRHVQSMQLRLVARQPPDHVRLTPLPPQAPACGVRRDGHRRRPVGLHHLHIQCGELPYNWWLLSVLAGERRIRGLAASALGATYPAKRTHVHHGARAMRHVSIGLRTFSSCSIPSFSPLPTNGVVAPSKLLPPEHAAAPWFCTARPYNTLGATAPGITHTPASSHPCGHDRDMATTTRFHRCAPSRSWALHASGSTPLYPRVAPSARCCPKGRAAPSALLS